tara:strand:- start:878 stop:1096 length:219 start_codon:yes stop_codon:yes gene_type:complete
MIKKPDDNARITMTIIISIGIIIKFFEITMENILIENNNLLILNYLLPIAIFILIIIFLFLNINLIKEKLKK